MIKHQQQMDNAPIYKKIQNYIFKFSDLLGQGNFSKVYKAHHQISNEIVAIKIVELESLKSKKLQELLFSEIDVLKKLNHPNVLRCHEVFTSNRNCYIITQLCNEGDLQSRLRKDRCFDEYRAEPIIKDIFEGLYYLAEKNVIHRDLKVANVFMHNNHAKIADFGFAKFTKQKFKDINIGSPIYMSPEGFISNIYGPKTDVWAFGVLIYQLLHGETPFSSCKTEAELKQCLSIPISKTKFRQELTTEIKQVILRCMDIDEPKRITIFELANLPYFKRILKKEPIYNQYHTPGVHGSSYDLRLRSPSYNGDNSKFLKSQQAQVKRKVSIEKAPPQPYTPQYIRPNMPPPPQDRGHNQGYPGFTSKGALQIPSEENSRDRRAMSSQKFFVNGQRQVVKLQKSPIKHRNNTNTSIDSKTHIIWGSITFKECVNILHYGRLIFKFLLTLKVSQYSNDNELFKLSKWLMDLLAEIKQKIQKKQIIYEGQNASLRQQKLKEVRSQYQKKYRTQLEYYISTQNSQHFGVQVNNLDYIKSFCQNLFKKYDQLISKDQNKSVIMLGHCIILMCEVVKMLKQSYQSKQYHPFLSYKDIEVFLTLSKDQIDINSYHNYRKKMAYLQYQ